VAILALLALAVKFIVDWFLATNFGLAVQSTGDNPVMASSMGISTDATKIITLMVSNGLVGLSGSLVAQYGGFADISAGVGMILIGLASVIVGNAILGTRFMFLASLGVIVGAVAYRMVIFFALRWDVLSSQDMRFISAVLVVLAMVVSQSKTLRGFFARISPWRKATAAPEPLLAVPATGEEEN
jgi:putative ABC transport system permease protein